MESTRHAAYFYVVKNSIKERWMKTWQALRAARVVKSGMVGLH
jgi:hypothetical protein